MMDVILGLDAAWNKKNASGVALVASDGARARVIRAAASFVAFLGGGGSEASVDDVLARATEFAGDGRLRCVAVDMPLARSRIMGRRVADSKVSQAFGAALCATHSPSDARPGAWGCELQGAIEREGFVLQVEGDPPGAADRALIEVYPHPAILSLTGEERRLCYKAKYRRDVRADAFAQILAALEKRIEGVGACVTIPAVEASRAVWKQAEDSLDALVCCWVGLEYVNGRATPYGDRDAAIWIPLARQ